MNSDHGKKSSSKLKPSNPLYVDINEPQITNGNVDHPISKPNGQLPTNDAIDLITPPYQKSSVVNTTQFNGAAGSVLVLILQCETKSCDSNINNLKFVFSDPYFIVQVCAVEEPPSIPTSSQLTEDEYKENYCMRKALLYASEGPYITNTSNVSQPQYQWTNLPCLIVKDSSVSNITPTSDSSNLFIGGMPYRIQVALTSAPQADLCYLCKWADKCQQYTDVDNITSINHGSSLKWTTSPNGTQAIMYMPKTRDFVQEALITSTIPLDALLNGYVSQGQLLSTTFVPNIIDFDIQLATSNADYAKLNECDPTGSNSTTTQSVSSYIWFIIIVCVILLVAWSLIVLMPKNRYKTGNVLDKGE